MELARDNIEAEVMLQQSPRYTSQQFLHLLYGGVNMSLPDFGGPECGNYRSPDVILTDTILLLAGSISVGWWAYGRLKRHRVDQPSHGLMAGRQVLLVAFCFVMGITLGFKLATRQVIYMLQPCHVISMFQIYLLAAPANKHTTTMFRVHIGFLNGAVLALVFPPTEGYVLPGQVEMFWIQHILMIVVPLYLAATGEPYTCESFGDLSYSGMSSSLTVWYHVLILQPINILTGMNVDYTLCPPPTLPYFVSGRHYLLAAGLHVPLGMTVVAKIIGVLAFYLTPTNPEKMASKLT